MYCTVKEMTRPTSMTEGGGSSTHALPRLCENSDRISLEKYLGVSGRLKIQRSIFFACHAKDVRAHFSPAF
jgi:hypothetical protein